MAAMPPHDASDSALLSLIETYASSSSVYSSYSNYLKPFSDYGDKMSSDPKLARSLAKKYVSFLNLSLKILPKRLSQLSNGHQGDRDTVKELIRTFELCVDCTEFISHLLTIDSVALHDKRVNLVCQAEALGFYEEAEAEGFRVLNILRTRGTGKLNGISSSKSVGVIDASIAMLLVRLVLVIVKCVFQRKSDDNEYYCCVIELIKDSQHWFGLLDSSLYDKIHPAVVDYLGKCSLLMMPKMKTITLKTLQDFCMITLLECSKSASKNQLFKVVRKMVYSLLFISSEKPTEVKHILRCIFKFLAQPSKVKSDSSEKYASLNKICLSGMVTKLPRENVDVECWETELLDEVLYVVLTCIRTRDDTHASLANFLHNFSDDPVFQNYSMFSVFLKIYSAAIKVNGVLCTKTVDSQSRDSLEGPSFAALVANSSIFSNVATLLDSFRSHIIYDRTEPRKASSVNLNPSHSSSDVCGKILRYYIEALRLICHPISDIVMFWKFETIINTFDASIISILRIMREVCHELCLFYLLNNRDIYKIEEFVADFKIAHAKAIIASFFFSLATKNYIQESMNLIEDTAISGIMEPENQKFVSDFLYHHGVILYQANWMNEASETLLLFCKVSWNSFLSLCQICKNGSADQIGYSKETVLDYFNELCSKNSLVIGLLWNFSILKATEVFQKSVESWVLAEKGIYNLPFPIIVVEQWAKVIVRVNEKGNCSNHTMFPMFTSSSSISNKDLRLILEQELYICEKMESSNPELFKSMQMKVAGLLNNVIAEDDNAEHISTIMLRKAWSQCDGTHHGLKRCINVLSEAILLMEGERCECGVLGCYRLVTAYCLRALSCHEDEPNSELVTEDVETALEKLKNVFLSHHKSRLSGENIFPRSFLSLLCNIIDLLALLSTSKLYIDFLTLIFTIFKKNGVPLAKFVSLFWSSKRLAHPLCNSPIDEAILNNLSAVYSDLDGSIEFWIECLNDSPFSSAGFELSFCFRDNRKIHLDDLKDLGTLMQNGCKTNLHMFGVADLCYASCSELISKGELFQALGFAKEALGLRASLFEEKFECSYDEESHNVNAADHYPKGKRRIVKLRVRKSAATEFWPLNMLKVDFELCYISPWKILQCYLESIFQTGILHDMIGNGLQAEALLHWGKSLSILQKLPFFIMSFSLALGKFYYKKKCWDMAEMELKNAEQVRVGSSKPVSCSKCDVMLEVGINQQLAAINFNRWEAPIKSDMDKVICFESLFRSSLERLSDFMFKSPMSIQTEGQCTSVNTSSVLSNIERRPTANKNVCKKLAKFPKTVSSDLQPTTYNQGRMTRSRYRKEKPDVIIGGQTSLSNNYKIVESYNNEDTVEKNVKGDDSMCICENLGCWFCLENEVRKSGSLSGHIYWKWEISRRRLCSEILANLGKVLEVRNDNHETHEITSQRISVLYNRNTFSSAPPDPLKQFFNFRVEKHCWDIFPIERAEILLDISWLVLKSHAIKPTGTSCCEISDVQLPNLVDHLIETFVACRCIPDLLKKVSKLLSVIFVLSSLNYLESLPSYCKALSESHWASFFHEVSINVNFTCKYLLNAISKEKNRCHFDNECHNQRGKVKSCNLLRIVPDTVTKLEDFVKEFFAQLPQTTIICISLLDEDFQSILSYILKTQSWFFISCLNGACEPLVMVLPVSSLSEETLDERFTSLDIDDRSDQKHWNCPWGHSTVDDLASQFRHILDNNYLNASKPPPDDTKESRRNWWNRRLQLNSHLSELLRKIEETWFGAWKYAFFAQQSLNVDSAMKLIKRNTKSKSKVSIGDSLLRALINIASHLDNFEAFLSQPFSLKGNCVLAKPSSHYNEPHHEYQQIYKAINQFLHDSASEITPSKTNSTEPLILVLDSNIQMLPLESLPFFRNQEIYRMPSVTSILMALNRNASPTINPLNSFYLINPSGDLPKTQSQFESLFLQQRIQGKAGTAPTVQELASALESHDVFIYMGHGSGERYISNRKVEELNQCAGSVLLGCSSGCLTLSGPYAPEGAPLAYLMGGSPFIVANLWDVTDLDIDRFGGKMLKGLLNGSENWKDSEGRISLEMAPPLWVHRQRVGALLSEARDACKLPFLTGAAPVCYGVPTVIRRNNL